MEEFKTGAKRSERKPRYDLIPKVAIDRLAKRFTGAESPMNSFAGIERAVKEYTGGALKYGECNWEKGLPTSDVINHIYDHLTAYVDAFRRSLKVNNGNMFLVKRDMEVASLHEDDLAGAMWGIVVLMHQESFDGVFHHDDNFKAPNGFGLVYQSNDNSSTESNLKETEEQINRNKDEYIKALESALRITKGKLNDNSSKSTRKKSRNSKRR